MANPTISISGFSLLPERLQAGTPFTATITAKNNLGATALYAYLTAHIDMEGLDAGDSGAGRVNLYSSGVQQISIANGASKALTFSGTISETALDELNAILEKYPSAPIRRNAIIWTLHMDNGGFEYSADTIYNAGELLDAFYSPAIEAFRLERCMDGVPNDEGESLLSTIKLGLAEKARQALLSLKLYYSESAPAAADSDFIDLSSSIPDLIGGITDSAELIAQTFGNTANWNFLLVFGDEYESAVAAFSLSRAFANMHLSGATTGGVAFGGFSTSGEGDPKLESHYPFFAYAGINGVTNYSRDEVKIGRWIDGKPLYKKTCVLNVNAIGNTALYVPISDSMDIAFVESAMLVSRDQNGLILIEQTVGSAGGRLFNLAINNKRVECFSTAHRGTAYINVCYTKITD